MAASLMLAGCGGGDEEPAAANSPSPSGGNPSGGNSAPTISGNPPSQALQGSEYDFMPAADDADGDTLVFSVTGLPPWAVFDSATGEISGMPDSGDLGVYANIRITVTDGDATASLASFTIEVVATATGAATLSWTAPTERTDGSPLTDLAGYKIYWGRSQGSYPNSVTLDNPGLTSHMVEQLTSGTWYFVATAYDTSGFESQFSNSASKTIL